MWVGALIGVNVFLSQISPTSVGVGSTLEGTADDSSFNFALGQKLVDAILVVHLLTFLVWLLTERATGLAQFDSKLLHESELFLLVGFGVAATISELFIGISLFLLALAVTIVAIRMKSYWSLVNLICLLAISDCCFFPVVNIAPNNILVVVFITDLVSAPFLDLYFNPSSVFDRYLPLFRVKHAFRLFILLSLSVVQLLFFAMCTLVVFERKAGNIFVTIPGFVVFGFLWICFHLIYFLTMWKLVNRITDCMPHISKLDENVAARLSKVMASKGQCCFSISIKNNSLVCL